MKKSLTIMLAFSILLSPFASLAAISGVDADDIYVAVKAKQGGEWITAYKGKTDDNSSLRLKGILPGKYKFEIDDDDTKAGQKLGLKLKMKDVDGKNIKKKTDVDAYIYIGDSKVFINRFRTKDNGYLNLEGITPGMTYELKVKGDGKVKKDENLARIKTKTKIDGSDWFNSTYNLLDLDPTGLTNGILEVENVLPGKYKFKVKSGDPYDARKPFMLKARMRKDNGKKIKESTKVTIYAYPNKIKTKVGEVMTDAKGWILLPEVQPHVKYRLKVKD